MNFVIGAIKTYYESKRTQKRKKDHNIGKDINRTQRRVHVRSFVDIIYLFSDFKGPLFDGFKILAS